MEGLTTPDQLGSLGADLHLAIGVFDGIHLGHQAVIQSAVERARAAGGRSVVVSFDPHPISVLRPDQTPRLLTSIEQKRDLINKLGVDALLLVHFDKAFSATPAEKFVNDLSATGAIKSISVGEGWNFGYRRQGNVALLRSLGERLGFEVCPVSPVESDGTVVSSTAIRNALESGNLGLVRRLLGRDFSVRGQVLKGQQKGRELGFPTANLSHHGYALPSYGVYAMSSTIDGIEQGGVGNFGVRPTVDHDDQTHLEVHFIDFDKDLYGRELEIKFLAWIRGEQAFSGLDALRDQIANDLERAKELLE